MAKPTSAPTATPSKRHRSRTPTPYIATIVGAEPIIVVAHTQRAALDAVLTIRPATHSELMTAGKEGYRVIDTTVPAAQVHLVDAVREATA
jgi:hypothetical protein